MFIRFDESHADLEGTLMELPPIGMPHYPQEQDPVRAGQGGCKSCSCPGYIPDKPNYCKCGHHFSQHK